MKNYSGLGFLNIGTGEDITIADFASEVASVVGYKGKIVFNKSRPDGPPQKLLNITKINKLGWSAKIRLHDGLASAYADFLAGGDYSAGLPATDQADGLRANAAGSMLITDRYR